MVEILSASEAFDNPIPHMTASSKIPLADKTKERVNGLRKKLREAYERGATSEVTESLVDEFGQLRKPYEAHLKTLRKQLGL